LAKTTPPEFPRPEFPKPELEIKPKSEPEIVTSDKSKETPLEYVQRILAEYDGLESNIPIAHDYWEVKRRI